MGSFDRGVHRVQRPHGPGLRAGSPLEGAEHDRGPRRPRRTAVQVVAGPAVQIATAAERARIACEMYESSPIAHRDDRPGRRWSGYAAGAAPPQRPWGARRPSPRRSCAALTDTRCCSASCGATRPPLSGAGTRARGPADRSGTSQGLRNRRSPTSVRWSSIGVLAVCASLLVRMGGAAAPAARRRLTIYRIAQESLTNVLKHAGPYPLVTVLVQWSRRDRARGQRRRARRIGGP